MFKKLPDTPPPDPTPEKDPPFSNPRSNGKRRTAEQKAILNQRIEQVRGLLRLSVTRGEIKRMMSKAWGIKSRCVEPYLTEARKRNIEHIGPSEDDLLAQSLDYWAKKKQEFERESKKARDRIEQAETELEAANETLESAFVSAEIAREANKRRTLSARILFEAHKTLERSESRSMDVQRTMDSLLGLGRQSARNDDSQTSSSYQAPNPVDTMTSVEQIEYLRKMHAEVLARKANPPDAVTA